MIATHSLPADAAAFEERPARACKLVIRLSEIEREFLLREADRRGLDLSKLVRLMLGRAFSVEAAQDR